MFLEINWEVDTETYELYVSTGDTADSVCPNNIHFLQQIVLRENSEYILYWMN